MGAGGRGSAGSGRVCRGHIFTLVPLLFFLAEPKDKLDIIRSTGKKQADSFDPCFLRHRSPP